jgi:Zn-dependent protease with chaperone function
MDNLLVVKLWKHKWPAFSALGTMVAVFFWPAVPLRGISDWLEFFYYYTPQNFLYALLTLLAGLYVGIYVYNKKVSATCRLDAKKFGATGMIGGVLLGACPACIPALGIFLPLSVSIYLSRISWMFLVGAIILMMFLVYRMDGFRKVPA